MNRPGDFASIPPSNPPRLLEQLRQAARAFFPLAATAERYTDWVRQFIFFHGKRHPRELGVAEVGLFLDHLAKDGRGLAIGYRPSALGSRPEPIAKSR